MVAPGLDAECILPQMGHGHASSAMGGAGAGTAMSGIDHPSAGGRPGPFPHGRKKRGRHTLRSSISDKPLANRPAKRPHHHTAGQRSLRHR